MQLYNLRLSMFMRYTLPIEAELEKHKISLYKLMKRSFFVSIGALFVALGLKSFLVPNHIIDGGIVGISIIFAYVTGIRLELFLLILNLPFLYLGLKKLGIGFVITTLIGLSLLSLCISFLYNVPVPTHNLFLASIFGGILLGFGVGMVIRYGGSLDGTEILGILINRATTFSVGGVVMFINVFIFISAGFVFGWDKAVYSILTYFIASKMIDVTIDG
ncbi:YitT family protein [Schinkia sp. CFF1]